MDIRAHYLFNNQYRAFYVVNDILADTAGNKGRKCTFAAVAHNNEVYAFFFSVFGNEIAWCAQDSDFIMGNLFRNVLGSLGNDFLAFDFEGFHEFIGQHDVIGFSQKIIGINNADQGNGRTMISCHVYSIVQSVSGGFRAIDRNENFFEFHFDHSPYEFKSGKRQTTCTIIHFSGRNMRILL